MTELEQRSTRQEIAALEYDGESSLTDAETLRRKLAAAVQVAQRARSNELETMLAAREADRALGRMILAAREAGDLAGDGQPAGRMTEAVITLNSFGISRNLAADAVALAQVPDDVWRKQLDDTEVLAEATYRAVTRWARNYLDAWKRAKQDREDQIEEAERLQKQAERRLAELRKQEASAIPVPPLTDDETTMVGADVALGSVVSDHTADEQRPAKDDRPEVLQQEKLIKSIIQLVDQIERCNPTIRDDAFRDADVYAARSAVRRLIDSATVWLRTLNTIYADLGKDTGRG